MCTSRPWPPAQWSHCFPTPYISILTCSKFKILIATFLSSGLRWDCAYQSLHNWWTLQIVGTPSTETDFTDLLQNNLQLLWSWIPIMWVFFFSYSHSPQFPVLLPSSYQWHAVRATPFCCICLSNINIEGPRRAASQLIHYGGLQG